MLKYLTQTGLKTNGHTYGLNKARNRCGTAQWQYTDILNHKQSQLNEDVYWSVSIFDKPTKPHLRRARTPAENMGTG